MELFVTVIIAIVGSSGISTLIVTLLQRKWAKEDNADSFKNDIRKNISDIKDSIKELKDVGDEREAKNARIRILRFGDEILHDQNHSKEHYDQTLLDISEYNDYCKDHPDFTNDMTVMTSANIKKKYQEHLDNHDFL